MDSEESATEAADGLHSLPLPSSIIKENFALFAAVPGGWIPHGSEYPASFWVWTNYLALEAPLLKHHNEWDGHNFTKRIHPDRNMYCPEEYLFENKNGCSWLDFHFEMRHFF